MFYLGGLLGGIILFKMESFEELGVTYQPKNCHDSKNPPKIVDSNEHCDVQVECNSEEYIKLNKRFNKVMRKLDKRPKKNVPTTVKNIQHKGKDDERQKLNYSYRLKGIQCLNHKDFGHIQAKCSSVPMEQRRISNVYIDEKGESNLAKNVVTFKDVKEAMHSSEQLYSKKSCIALFHKPDAECQITCLNIGSSMITSFLSVSPSF